MSQAFLLGFDGSAGAERALEYAITQAKAADASLVVAHVLEWSPYSFLTQEEIAERHKRREEELERAEQHVLGPVLQKLQDAGLSAEAVMRYGNVTKTLCEIATEKQATQMFVGRNGAESISERLFGTSVSSLVQVAEVPVTVVP